MVVALVAGELRPVAKTVPPVGASYQRTLAPKPGVAGMVAPPQMVADVAVGGSGTGPMVRDTASLAAVLSQPVVVL